MLKISRLTAGLIVSAAVAAGVAPAAQAADTWNPVRGKLSRAGAEVNAERFKAFTLDTSALKADLAGARKGARATGGTTVLAVPAPDGTLQRFSVYETSIMEPGLAAKHPEIKTYAGQGIDDPHASIVADTSPLGFHASVRARRGSYYVDPYYKGDDSVYASYYTRDAVDDEAKDFVESDPVGESKSADASAAAALGPEVQLRTYRLALVTDPSYANYHGAENVTAAKVTLINRVNQIYNTESAIKLVLINDTDKLNLNTVAMATGPNGPCGAAPCYTATNSCNSVLNRNRFVIGQIVGAANYDVGHIAMGNAGGGVAGLGVVGGANKATGCTGLATPVGDYFAVDYVAHEMGHQFNANHTFNGTLINCGGNRSGATSVEPGSGSSIMAYAGICGLDNLQPHSDPYWVPKSHEEITSLITNTPPRPLVNEVQNVALRDFDGTDSFTIGYGDRTTAPIVRGTNYSAAAIQTALQGASEVQTVALTGYDADGDAYRLRVGGADSHPIVRGQNNTAAGIQNALVGGNEQQQVSFTGFSTTTGSFRVSINGQTSGVIGAGGVGYSNANIAAAINAIEGFSGTVSASGANANGFTLTFGGASANADVPTIAIVDCSCSAATVRENAKGGTGLATLPAGTTVAVGGLADTGYTLTFSGASQGTDVPDVTIVDGTGGTAGTVTETTKGTAGILPAGATAMVAGFFGGTFNDTGFQVSFGGGLAGVDVESLTVTAAGATAFVGETNHGGEPGNQGNVVTPTGNHAPDVTVPAPVTIPPRTPFTLTGSATDPDGDPLTYMWEQVDQAGIQGVTTAGTPLLSQTKTNGVLFRQFGTTADISPEDTLKYNSPGLNAPGTSPTRTFPDMLQILENNTNAKTGRCEVETPPATGASNQLIARNIRECFGEFLPTTDWLGFLSDRTMTFRLTARDGLASGGGVGFAETKVTIAPLAGPFQVTSIPQREVIFGTTTRTITWDVAGTDVAPIGVANVKISLSTDGGLTYPITLLESTPNDGAAEVTFPQVTAERARIKVEAIGNVFFDVNDADFALQAAPTSTPGGTVPATLTLTLGPAAQFGAFTPGITRTYFASTTANVVSTAGDALLSVSDPSAVGTGHLVNGSFVLPEPLQARARNADNTGTAYNNVGSAASPLNLLTWSAPISNDAVTLEFSQLVKENDPLRTGTYSKPLTFTLSTTTP